MKTKGHKSQTLTDPKSQFYVKAFMSITTYHLLSCKKKKNMNIWYTAWQSHSCVQGKGHTPVIDYQINLWQIPQLVIMFCGLLIEG